MQMHVRVRRYLVHQVNRSRSDQFQLGMVLILPVFQTEMPWYTITQTMTRIRDASKTSQDEVNDALMV